MNSVTSADITKMKNYSRNVHKIGGAHQKFLLHPRPYIITRFLDPFLSSGTV